MSRRWKGVMAVLSGIAIGAASYKYGFVPGLWAAVILMGWGKLAIAQYGFGDVND